MKPIGTQLIQTERLVLRRVQASDAKALVDIRSLPMSLKEAERAVSDMVGEAGKPFGFHWVITLDGRVIGRIKGWDVSPYNGYVQLGYDIGPAYRRNGYMTEAARAVIEYLMTKADANRVYCSVRESNQASARVCLKCDMKHEGTLRRHYARQDGSFEDVLIFGILQEDWKKEGQQHGD